MSSATEGQWSNARAWAWYRARAWLCGFNYVPSNAINTTEMWQRDTFDLETIDRELGWAETIGFNTCRIFLQYLVWEQDGDAMLDRLDQFLAVADRHGLSVMICPFDDVGFSGKQPYLGPQDSPIPGVHNSGWVPSPGHARVVNRAAWPQLEAYIRAVVGRFAHDPRVLLWDLYNEPGNASLGNQSLPLLEATFAWARARTPDQPLTAGVWDPHLVDLNKVSVALSDVVSFHDYLDIDSVRHAVDLLRDADRPILCTEWMRRNHGSLFESHLPYFKREGIGNYFWGLVQGRTQTYFPWGSPEGAAEPPIWFHDLLRTDGSPYMPAEVDLLTTCLRIT